MDTEPTPKSSDVHIHRGSNRLGLTGLILSVVGVLGFGCWLLTVPGLILSLIGLRKEPRTAAIAGTVFGGIGILEFIVLSPMILVSSAFFLRPLEIARERAKITITTNQIHKLEMASDIYYDDQGNYPFDFQDLLFHSNLIDEEESERNDAWGNAMKLNGGPNTRPKITSAGSDGIFDTEDDVTTDDGRSSDEELLHKILGE